MKWFNDSPGKNNKVDVNKLIGENPELRKYIIELEKKIEEKDKTIEELEKQVRTYKALFIMG